VQLGLNTTTIKVIIISNLKLKFMQIIEEIDINKIKFDKKQPRQTIDELDLREMAQSIITEGVINPIEVDKNYIVITGERRTRAARIAGLKTVPVKVIDIKPDNRFMRQVIENIHNNTMTDWDTAIAFKKLIETNLLPQQVDSGRGGNPQTGLTWLAQKTGRSVGYIQDKLNILEQSKEWKKSVKEGKKTGKFTTALMKTPEQFKKVVEKKFLDGEFITRDGAREFASALKREQDNPQIIKELLETDYSKYKGFHEVETVVAKISPRDHVVIAKVIFEPSQEISKIGDEFKEWVKRNPRESWNPMQAPRIIANLNFIKAMAEEVLSTNGKKLLGKK